MMKLKQYYTIKLLILLSVIILTGCKGIDSVVTNEHYLVFENLKDTIFLKSKTWGLLGNHNKVYLTSYPKEDFEYDSLRDFRFVSERTIFLDKRQDSLLIYLVNELEHPQNFGSDVKIKQIECNYSEFKELEQNHKALGIYKFESLPDKDQ